MRMQGYIDVYKWTILKRTSPEVKCLHPTSSRREMCTSSVSNVIYHKFSHGAAFYSLNGKNVNVMLECSVYRYFQTEKLLGCTLRLTISFILKQPSYYWLYSESDKTFNVFSDMRLIVNIEQTDNILFACICQGQDAI